MAWRSSDIGAYPEGLAGCFEEAVRAGGYSALSQPEHLPSVLVEVLRRLVRA